VDLAKLKLLELMASEKRWYSRVADTELSAENILIKTPNESIVVRLETQEGINVQAGTPLITIQETTKPRIIALLAPRYAPYVIPGQTATVQWDSGLSVKATVLYAGTISSRIPEKMRNFRNQGQGIVVELELLETIPVELAINELPVKVRFSRNLF
jgi:multidrug resistance efflux pump